MSLKRNGVLIYSVINYANVVLAPSSQHAPYEISDSRFSLGSLFAEKG